MWNGDLTIGLAIPLASGKSPNSSSEGNEYANLSRYGSRYAGKSVQTPDTDGRRQLDWHMGISLVASMARAQAITACVNSKRRNGQHQVVVGKGELSKGDTADRRA